MTTKVRSRSKRGSSTTPPPPVVSSDPSEARAMVPDALESSPTPLELAAETPPPSSVDMAGGAAGEKTPKKRRSRAPAAQALDGAGIPLAAESKPSRAPRARKSKTPPPPEVTAVDQLALTPTPLPSIANPGDPLEGSSAPPGADFTKTLVDAPSSVDMAPGGWRAPDATPDAAAVTLADAPRAASASEPDPDEVSVPPVVSDEEPAAASAELDDHFFSQPAPAAARAAEPHPIDEVEIRDPKVVQKMSAAVQQRRNRLAKYVKWAVGVSATLCLVAFVRQKLDVAPQEAAARGAATMEVRRAPAATPEPKAAEPKPAEPTAQPTAEAITAPSAATAEPAVVAVASASASASAAEGPKPATAPDPTAAEPDETTPPTPPTEEDVKAARKARIDANNALERGDLAKAIEAGEAAVKLDRTDGHAWYILGSAYMMKGDRVNQVRCFSRCLDAKGGNKGECAQFGGRRAPKP